MDEDRKRRFPSVASMVFFAVVAVLGLVGANLGGHRTAELQAPGSAGEHRNLAAAYREKAVTAQREAAVHRALVQRTRDATGDVLIPDELQVRRRKLAEAAEELSRIQLELAAYHEEQARVLLRGPAPAR